MSNDVKRQLIEEGRGAHDLLGIPRNLRLRVIRTYEEDGIRHVVYRFAAEGVELPLTGSRIAGEAYPFPESINDVLNGVDEFMRRIAQEEWYHSKGFTVTRFCRRTRWGSAS